MTDGGSSQHPAYAVDLDLLLETIGSLTRCETRCDESLDAVSARMRGLHDTWDGAAAAAQLEAQARWEAGFAQMREGLSGMRTAAEAAHGNYSSAIDTNVSMWGSL